MNKITSELEFDRRGRIYAGGSLIGHEDEVETFKKLTEKYLAGELRQLTILTDPPKFDVAQDGMTARKVAAISAAVIENLKVDKIKITSPALTRVSDREGSISTLYEDEEGNTWLKVSK